MLNLALRIIGIEVHWPLFRRFTPTSPALTQNLFPGAISVAFIEKTPKPLARVVISSLKIYSPLYFCIVLFSFTVTKTLGMLLVYRDEVSSTAVDVNAVVIYRDDFIGLRHEEGCTAELRTLWCEGELTLHCDHVQASWEAERPASDNNKGRRTSVS